jgi:signal transduction histidine kinase
MQMRRVLCWLFPLLQTVGVHGQILPAQESGTWTRIQKFDVNNGLPIGSVYDITQTPDGLLWFATGDGLVISDGESIIQPGSSIIPAGLGAGNSVLTVRWQVDHLWARTTELTFVKAGNEWSIKPGIQGEYQLIDHRGDLNIFREKDGSYFTMRLSNNVAPFAKPLPEGMKAGFERDEVIGYRGSSVFEMREGTMKWEAGPEILSLPAGIQPVYVAPFRESGWLVLGRTENGALGAYHCEKNSTKLANTLPDLVVQPDNPVRVLTSRNGRLIVQILDQAVLELHFRLVDGALNVKETFRHTGRIRNHLVDGYGDLWIVEDAAGISRYRITKRTFETLGGPGRLYKGLQFDEKEMLWAAFLEPYLGLETWDITSRSKIRTTQIVQHSPGYVTFSDPSSPRFYVTSDDGFVYVMNTETGNRESQIPFHRIVLAVMEAPDGKPLIFDDSTLYSMEEGRVTGRFNITVPGEKQEPVSWRTASAVTGHTLWVTSGDRLKAFNSETKEIVSIDKPAFLYGELRSITADRFNPWLWIGSTNGLAVFDYSKNIWMEIPETKNWPSRFIYGILLHAENEVWVSTNHGLVRFRYEWEGNGISGNSRFFNKRDGVASEEFNSYSAARSKDGRMVFGGMDGLTVFHPDSIKPAPVTYKPVLIAVEHMNRILDFAQWNQKFPVSENQFRFTYTSSYAVDAAKIRFQIRLRRNGAGTWIDQGNRRELLVSGLAHGSYGFEVRVVNEDGIALLPETLFTFELLPPFWMRWWFVLSAAIIILISVSWVVKMLSTRKLREKLRLLEMERKIQDERQRVRDSIARDLHDDLASTMGSAGLFLEAARRKVNEEPEEAKRYLDKSGTILSDAGQAMSDIIWAVSPQHDSLESLWARIQTLVREQCKAAGIAVDVERVGGNNQMPLDEDLRKALYMCVKESLFNSLKYANATHIAVTLTATADALELEIRDNGIGFDINNPDTGLGGNGLKNMRERAFMAGAILEIQSGLRSGTRISVKKTFMK